MNKEREESMLPASLPASLASLVLSFLFYASVPCSASSPLLSFLSFRDSPMLSLFFLYIITPCLSFVIDGMVHHPFYSFIFFLSSIHIITVPLPPIIPLAKRFPPSLPHDHLKRPPPPIYPLSPLYTLNILFNELLPFFLTLNALHPRQTSRGDLWTLIIPLLCQLGVPV